MHRVLKAFLTNQPHIALMALLGCELGGAGLVLSGKLFLGLSSIVLGILVIAAGMGKEAVRFDSDGE